MFLFRILPIKNLISICCLMTYRDLLFSPKPTRRFFAIFFCLTSFFFSDGFGSPMGTFVITLFFHLSCLISTFFFFVLCLSLTIFILFFSTSLAFFICLLRIKLIFMFIILYIKMCDTNPSYHCGHPSEQRGLSCST